MGRRKGRKVSESMKYKRYPKRDAIKNYFPLPNEIFNLDLLSGEITVYSFLVRCEDRKTFQCHPSYKTIGKALKMSQNTVRKYVAGLIDKKLITAEPTKMRSIDGRKRNGSLLYTILPIEEAVRQNYELQMQRNAKIIAAEQFQKRIVEPDIKQQ